MKQEALIAFNQLLDPCSVISDKNELLKYTQACIPVDTTIQAAIKPKTTKEVQSIVLIAAKYGLSLYPISTGQNWGYGSANPVRKDNIIVDLSMMNKIIEVNKTLAYAVIQPGVTQEQLYQYLEKENCGLMMDPTGSGPSCSVLGNTLERGYGITPYGDHFDVMSGMEIVLANGEILNTGFGHFKNSKVTRLFKYGTGPYLDGIFTQSNFGIVTSIGIWLMPKPEYFETCYFSTKEEDGLKDLVESTRWLLLNRIVKGSINLMHRDRILTLMIQYPWDEMKGKKPPLKEDIAKRIAEKKDIGAWNGVVSLYGTKEEVKAAKKVIRRVLKNKCYRLNFVSDNLLKLVERFEWAVTPIGKVMGMDVKELIKVLRPSFDLMKGKPSEISLPTPYWRMKKPIPKKNINPAKDNCGLFWIAPVVPMEIESTKDFIATVKPIFTQHGFETCITFTAVTHRAFDCTLPLLYDKDDATETESALKCYHQVVSACIEKGYIPYRFGIQSMEDLVKGKDVFWDVAAGIKNTLDPKGIISPGRYSRY